MGILKHRVPALPWHSLHPELFARRKGETPRSQGKLMRPGRDFSRPGRVS